MANVGVLLGPAFRHTSLMTQTQTQTPTDEFRQVSLFVRAMTDDCQQATNTQGEWINPYDQGDTEEWQGWSFYGDLRWHTTFRGTWYDQEEGVIVGEFYVMTPTGKEYEFQIDTDGLDSQFMCGSEPLWWE
jgi:hypothetical protein